MRKIFLTTIVLSSLVACTEKPVDYAIISGKATNTTDTYLRLLSNGSFVGEIVFNADGTFRDTIRDVRDNRFLLLDSEQVTGIPIYIEKGTELVINYDKEIKNASVSGKKSENTQYLLEKETFLQQKLGQDIFTKNPSEFKQVLTTTLDELNQKMEKYKLDEKFANSEKRWITYTRVFYLDQYPSFNKYITKSETLVEVPANFNPEKETLDYDNTEDYRTLTNYQRLVQGRYLTMVKDPNDAQQVTKLIEILRGMKAENIKKDISEALVSLMTPQNPNNEVIFSYITDNVTDETIKAKAKEVLDVSKSLVKGAVAPSFDYENYKGGKTKLEDLKGKVVYIDIWATWCRPCLNEIPHLKELEKEFHNKPIEFVSISIDRQEDKEKWKNFIKTENLKGVQLIADDAGNSGFVKACYVSGIPRFILIDKEGKIVDIDAPRPSDPNIRELLKSLL